MFHMIRNAWKLQLVSVSYAGEACNNQTSPKISLKLYTNRYKKGMPDGSPFFAYFPLNTGARFSENALTPSLKSSVPKSADMAIAS